ncbi:MAG: response regulator, partial [Planctomycetaceae bacterium]
MPSLLVIDDDRTVLHMVSRAFKEDDDIEVLTAQTAEEGLAAVKQRRPDVVLHDIVLP